MKSATYSNTAVPLEKFAENLTYDKMGNIKTILREGLIATATYGTIDNLTFGYTGNQLLYITDAGPNVNLGTSADFKDYSKVTTAEYTFNKNGAMTKDLNKGISSVAYNSLNLPLTMDIKSPVAEARNEYTYTATGAKLKVVKKWNPNYSTTPVIGTTINTSLLTLNETTDYIGNKIYENGILKRILTDNGYIEGNTYYFYIKDHLGNNRVVANASAGAIQSNQFYPFGMAFAEGTTTEQGKQEFKYNGKELDRSHELNEYDYQARFLDNAYGRFTTIDPLSEKFYNWSPYVYCYNNPMKFIDPDGKFPWVEMAVRAALDYTLQVAVNFIEDEKSTAENFYMVDPSSIVISAGASAAGAGLVSKAEKIIDVIKLGKKATKVAGVISETVVDASVSVTSQALEDGGVDATSVVVDVVAGRAAGKLGDDIKSARQNSPEGRSNYRQADRARRLAGENSRGSRQKAAKQSTQKAENYGNKSAAAAGTAASNTASSLYEEYKKKKDKK